MTTRRESKERGGQVPQVSAGSALLQGIGIDPEIAAGHGVRFWGDGHFVVPIRSRSGRVAFTELWHADDLRRPVWTSPIAELFPWGAVAESDGAVVFAEGVLEALALESHGVRAVAASGDGLAFRVREWAPHLRRLPRVVVALRRGERKARRRLYPSRDDIRQRILSEVPGTSVIEWPEQVGKDGGAAEFFGRLGRGPAELWELLKGGAPR